MESGYITWVFVNFDNDALDISRFVEKSRRIPSIMASSSNSLGTVLLFLLAMLPTSYSAFFPKVFQRILRFYLDSKIVSGLICIENLGLNLMKPQSSLLVSVC